MQQINFEEVLDRILEKDSRYDREAYLFLREALEFTQKVISKTNKNQVRHITGQELLAGVKDYALANFGPMTITVFNEWGISSCEDFGQMVFLMVENGLLRKTEQDSPEDFKNGYSFHEAFRVPFLPAPKRPQPELPEQTHIEKN